MSLFSRPKARWAVIGIGSLLLALTVAVVISPRFRNRANPKHWFRPKPPETLFDFKNAMLRAGNPGLKEIVITFDDGPHRESRDQILEALRRFHAKATFFEVGMRMEQNPDLLRKTIEEGHEIANHTMFHQTLPGLKPDTLHKGINEADIAYYRFTGKHLRLLRPPGMRFDKATLDEAKRLGYITVSYTTAAGDYGDHVDPKVVVDRTLQKTDNGGILLLHDYPATAQALPEILDTLTKQGYRFVTAEEMIQHLPPKERQEAFAFWNKSSEAAEAPRPSFLPIAVSEGKPKKS